MSFESVAGRSAFTAHLRSFNIAILLFTLPILTAAKFEATVAKPTNARNQSAEIVLKSYLLKKYDKTSRPVFHDNETVETKVGISLFHLMSVNERQQTLQATFSFRFSWRDNLIAWNESEYGLGTIFLPSLKIWRPDLFIYNTAMDSLHDYMDTNVIASSNGQVMWMVPYTPVTTCSMDMRYYPFDVQRCNLVFMSWSYSGRELNLTKHPSPDAIYYSSVNQEWEVTAITAARHDTIYACCPNDPYPDLTFTLHMRRQCLFHVINLIIPSLLIYALAVAGFWLPSNQRINMETTICLTLVVFLTIIYDTMPPTSDSLPVIGLLFFMILVFVSLATAIAVLVTNLSNQVRFSSIPSWGVMLIRFIFKKHADHLAIKAILERDRLQDKQENELRSKRESTDELNDGIVVILTDGTNSKTESATPDIQINEWKLFAEAVDIVLFYAFIASSIGMLIIFGIMLYPAVVLSIADPTQSKL